jgi:phosphatidylinositol alpha-mannosyltransferase
MRIALVSPYDWAVPGGVNSHVTNLGHQFMRRGHEVMIIAPASKQTGQEPAYVRIIGHSSIGLPASGSVANVSISFNLGSRVRHLLEREFDIVHIRAIHAAAAVPVRAVLEDDERRRSARRRGGCTRTRSIIEPWMHNVRGQIARIVRR